MIFGAAFRMESMRVGFRWFVMTKRAATSQRSANPAVCRCDAEPGGDVQQQHVEARPVRSEPFFGPLRDEGAGAVVGIVGRQSADRAACRRCRDGVSLTRGALEGLRRRYEF